MIYLRKQVIMISLWLWVSKHIVFLSLSGRKTIGCDEPMQKIIRSHICAVSKPWCASVGSLPAKTHNKQRHGGFGRFKVDIGLIGWVELSC